MKTVKDLQEFLDVTADGLWGAKSQAALDAVLHPVVTSPTIGANDDPVDDRSEKNISTLLEPVQELARRLVRGAAKVGIIAKVTSGTRTFEEQDALFAKGNVTKARGGYSNHNYGLAFDITVFASTGEPIWDGPQYKTIGELGKSLGLSWGGDWHSIVDEPHFELRPSWAKDMSESEMIAELRRRHSVGQKYF